MIEIIAAPFVTSSMYVEYLKDVGSLSLYFETPDNAIVAPVLNKARANRLYTLFDELWKAWKEATGEPWSIMIFDVKADGSFSTELGYDDVSDVGQYGARRKAWKLGRFGDRPTVTRWD